MLLVRCGCLIFCKFVGSWHVGCCVAHTIYQFRSMQRTISVIPTVGYFLGSEEERPVSVEVRDRVQWAL